MSEVTLYALAGGNSGLRCRDTGRLAGWRRVRGSAMTYVGPSAKCLRMPYGRGVLPTGRLLVVAACKALL